MNSVARAASTEEARAFADTVAAIAARHAAPDPWAPGAAVSDHRAGLAGALRDAGWEELGRDPRLVALAGPAGAALGGAFASLAPVDRLLGGALGVGELARYASDAEPVARPRGERLELGRATRITPVPYTDALGVHRVELADAEPLGREESARRMEAWSAASTGYLAGLAGEALRLALDHARSRRAFGGTLGSLEPVQQMLADAATAVDGLGLLASDRPGLDALAYAGEAAERGVTTCMQVTGALGFTLEFPLQRAYRRARAARAWAEGVLLAWEGS